MHSEPHAGILGKLLTTQVYSAVYHIHITLMRFFYTSTKTTDKEENNAAAGDDDKAASV